MRRAPGAEDFKGLTLFFELFGPILLVVGPWERNTGPPALVYPRAAVACAVFILA